LGELQRFCEEGRISDSLEVARLPSTNMVTQHERIPVPSLAMTTRIDSMSRLFELTLGDVRLSREFLLSCLAQLKSALQTNRYWRDLGAYPTNPQHGMVLALRSEVWFSSRRWRERWQTRFSQRIPFMR
jgi:hypothetical protein